MISVIIPIYNDIRHLKDCLNSVSAQSYKDLEIILVDDGSDEAAAKKIAEIARGLKVISISHSGAAAARNRGFAASRGEFVFFCDADVELSSQCLEKMMRALAENPGASYAYSDYNIGYKKMSGRPFDGAALKKCNYISTMSLIRRQDFSGFDEALRRFQDWDLWLTILERGGSGVYIPETLFIAHPAKFGISKWRPRIFYKLFPWTKSAKDYERAREIVLKKHNII